MGKPYFMDEIFPEKTFLAFGINEDRAYFTKGDTRELYALSRFSDRKRQGEYDLKKTKNDLVRWVVTGAIILFAMFMLPILDLFVRERVDFEILRGVCLAWMVAAFIGGVIYTRRHSAKVFHAFSEAAQTDVPVLVEDQAREKFLKDMRVRLKGQLVISLLALAGVGYGVYSALEVTLSILFLLGLVSAFLTPPFWRDMKMLGTRMKVVNQLMEK